MHNQYINDRPQKGLRAEKQWGSGSIAIVELPIEPAPIGSLMEKRMNNENLYEAPASNLANNNENADISNVLIIAKRQKALLFTFLAYFLIAGFSGAASPELKPLMQLAGLPLMLAVVIFTARLTLRLYGKVVAIIMIILSIIPLVNLIIVLVANSKANKTIKSRGFRVGLGGASIKEIESSI